MGPELYHCTGPLAAKFWLGLIGKKWGRVAVAVAVVVTVAVAVAVFAAVAATVAVAVAAAAAVAVAVAQVPGTELGVRPQESVVMPGRWRHWPQKAINFRASC